METLKENYFEIIDKELLKCSNERKRLIDNSCRDEADLESIKMNIYNIFKQLFTSFSKKASDKEAFCRVYLPLFDKIPAEWKVSLEKARQHNDVKNIVIEEIKLSVADRLKAQFQSLI
jgi:hypothetical protein